MLVFFSNDFVVLACQNRGRHVPCISQQQTVQTKQELQPWTQPLPLNFLPVLPVSQCSPINLTLFHALLLACYLLNSWALFLIVFVSRAMRSRAKSVTRPDVQTRRGQKPAPAQPGDYDGQGRGVTADSGRRRHVMCQDSERVVIVFELWKYYLSEDHRWMQGVYESVYHVSDQDLCGHGLSRNK